MVPGWDWLLLKFLLKYRVFLKISYSNLVVTIVRACSRQPSLLALLDERTPEFEVRLVSSVATFGSWSVVLVYSA